MTVFMLILVLAIPATALVVEETNDPPKLCSYYNVHEGRMIEGPCRNP